MTASLDEHDLKLEKDSNSFKNILQEVMAALWLT